MAFSQWTENAIDKQLANLYYAPGDPASYGGVDRLYERARDLNLPVDRHRVRKFLTEQVTYELHKPARQRFARNQTLVSNIDDQWQADLADMRDVSKDNDRFNYLLTCIDVLSRYAWVIPVRSKTSTHMRAAIQQLFALAAPRKPKRMQTDKGNEFHNAQVRKHLTDQGIELFSTNSDHKAAIVERFNRTLKARIFKHFTAQSTRRYINVLQDIVCSYNHCFHRTIGQRPVDVVTREDGKAVWRRVYYDSKEARLRRADAYPTNTDNITNVGDHVRLSRWKGRFEKGYVPSWSREHFQVKSVTKPRRGGNRRPVYKLKDMQDEDIEGVCYPEELQYVPPKAANTLEVERVLRKRRGQDNNIETLVRFKGWPEKFNRWLSDAELRHHQRPLREQQ
jgi:transposase InsO family protein